jgi:hypothetical protein
MHEGVTFVEETVSEGPRRSSRLAWFLVGFLVLLLVLAGVWIWQLTRVQMQTAPLTEAEQLVLEAKFDRIRNAAYPERTATLPEAAPPEDTGGAVQPEIYREDASQRQVRFTERELNALIAADPALAGRSAVRLSPGQLSASFRIDLPPDVPLMGGRSVRVQTGLQLATLDNRVEARLVGVSVGGIPLPNAWLGGLKGTDLLATSGLGSLGAGIETLSVGDGWLELQLAP